MRAMVLHQAHTPLIMTEPDPRGRAGISPFGTAHRYRHQKQTYPLAQANEALEDLRLGRFVGAAVLVP
jgi:hypothetical protein